MGESIAVGERVVGPGAPVFIVAEMSGNHNHDIRQAHAIIDAAAEAGADAIKLQTYTAETITLHSSRPEFQVTWQGKVRTLYDLYSEAYTPWEWHEELFLHARERNMVAFSTPFDASAVEFLERLRVPLYKVSSFEVVDIPLLERIGQTRKAVIMSRGMSSFAELRLAMDTLRREGTPGIALLQCVSEYPARAEDMRLKTIPYLAETFGVLAGLSDHSLGNESAIASTALGGCIVEKHLTLSRAEGGVDSGFSLEPHEFAALVRSIRTVEASLGEASDVRTRGEEVEMRSRKSLFASRDIKAGELFTEANIRSVRPGAGLPPRFYNTLLGKRAATDIPFATPLSWDMVERS